MHRHQITFDYLDAEACLEVLQQLEHLHRNIVLMGKSTAPGFLSQPDFEAVCTSQGSYYNAVQNTIAAYRGGKPPTIVQVCANGGLFGPQPSPPPVMEKFIEPAA